MPVVLKCKSRVLRAMVMTLVPMASASDTALLSTGLITKKHEQSTLVIGATGEA